MVLGYLAPNMISPSLLAPNMKSVSFQYATISDQIKFPRVIQQWSRYGDAEHIQSVNGGFAGNRVHTHLF